MNINRYGLHASHLQCYKRRGRTCRYIFCKKLAIFACSSVWCAWNKSRVKEKYLPCMHGKTSRKTKFLMEVSLWALAINHITMFAECHHFKAFNVKTPWSFQNTFHEAWTKYVLHNTSITLHHWVLLPSLFCLPKLNKATTSTVFSLIWLKEALNKH